MANVKILIEGDTNDADYTSVMREITQEQLDQFMPIIEAIKACKERHNWEGAYDNHTLYDLYPQFFERNDDYDPTDEYDDEFQPSNLLENFDYLVPTNEYGSVHTITRIEIYPCEPIRLL